MTIVGIDAAQQVFKSNVDAVTIPVSVKSGNKPVVGLTAGDFELRDNEVPQEIRTFAAEHVPLDLTLMLDASQSVDGVTLQRLKTAVNDTADLLRDGDRLRLIAISQVLREIFPFRTRGAAMPLDGLAAAGGTALYDALAAGMMRPTEPGRRQLVIAFTDGRDSASILDAAAAHDIARLSDAVVDVVMPSIPESQTPDRQLRDPSRQRTLDQMLSSSSNVVVGTPTEIAARARAIEAARAGRADILAKLIAPTAGEVFSLPAGDSISHAFRRMLDEYRASYVLQYSPQGVTPMGWHEIAVSIRRPGRYDVRARKGYQGQVKMSLEEHR